LQEMWPNLDIELRTRGRICNNEKKTTKRKKCEKSFSWSRKSEKILMKP